MTTPRLNGHDPRVGVWIVILFIVVLVAILVASGSAT
jgi:hypothetical protein